MNLDNLDIAKSSEVLTESSNKKDGLSFIMAGFFLIANMAGAGFLALPKAVADAGMIHFLICICSAILQIYYDFIFF